MDQALLSRLAMMGKMLVVVAVVLGAGCSVLGAAARTGYYQRAVEDDEEIDCTMPATLAALDTGLLLVGAVMMSSGDEDDGSSCAGEDGCIDFDIDLTPVAGAALALVAGVDALVGWTHTASCRSARAKQSRPSYSDAGPTDHSGARGITRAADPPGLTSPSPALPRLRQSTPKPATPRPPDLSCAAHIGRLREAAVERGIAFDATDVTLECRPLLVR